MTDSQNARRSGKNAASTGATTSATTSATTTVDAKLQRWVDVLAALLGRRHALTFEELARYVPEYDRKLCEAEQCADPAERRTCQQSLKRTFERDKQELRAFGIPLESVPDAEGNAEGAYQLKTRDFYLPYLSFMARDGVRSDPPRVDRDGYRALATLILDHEELAAVVHAAAAARELGDPLVAAAVDHALRKLAVDLPVGSVGSAADPQLVLPRARPANRTFEVLSDALHRGKRVAFDYHALSTNQAERREVEPYGLFFLNGHWYLVGHDRERDSLRNFRLNRVSAPKTNTGTALSRDFVVPPTFHLREHAASRHAWEMGDSDAMRVTVRATGASGPARAAGALGAAVPGEPDHRAFDVRRSDTFARWVLSSAGALVPLSPPGFVTEYRALLALTRAVYERPAASVEDTGASGSAASKTKAAGASTPWAPTGAAAQLRRVLQLIPRIADGNDHELSAVAQDLGTDVLTIHGDCYSLVERYDEPAGFVAGVQIMLEAERVSAVSSHLRRPMRLTVGELLALVLGLSVLRGRRTPGEHGTIDRAQAKLRDVVTMLPDAPVPEMPYAVNHGYSGDESTLATIAAGLHGSEKVRLVYRKSGGDAADTRLVCPYQLQLSNGMLYLVAFCDREEGVRHFRFDRIEGAERTDESFERPTDLMSAQFMEDGRVFQRAGAACMRVRYSPAIARWIAEREGRDVRDDGSLVMEHPLGDSEWALRHLMQYGAEAEALEPLELRVAMLERLQEMERAM